MILLLLLSCQLAASFRTFTLNGCYNYTHCIRNTTQTFNISIYIHNFLAVFTAYLFTQWKYFPLYIFTHTHTIYTNSRIKYEHTHTHMHDIIYIYIHTDKQKSVNKIFPLTFSPLSVLSKPAVVFHLRFFFFSPQIILSSSPPIFVEDYYVYPFLSDLHGWLADCLLWKMFVPTYGLFGARSSIVLYYIIIFILGDIKKWCYRFCYVIV